MTLLDVTDTRRRLLQHGTVALGILLLLGVKAVVGALGTTPLVLLAIGAGVGLCLLGLIVRQRWEVAYKGHRIRFENSPGTSERLFIDGQLVAKGHFGRRVRIQAAIPDGDGAGERIIAASDAGWLRFHLRLTAEPAA